MNTLRNVMIVGMNYKAVVQQLAPAIRASVLMMVVDTM
jgi:hypothetical protein